MNKERVSLLTGFIDWDKELRPMAPQISTNNHFIPSFHDRIASYTGIRVKRETGLHIFFESVSTITLVGLLSVLTWSPAFAQAPPSIGKSCKDDHVKLEIPLWVQEEGPWCWATTAATVMAYLGKINAPCFVADAVLRDKGELRDGIDCCDKEDRLNFQSGCIQPGLAGDAFRSFEFDYKYRRVDGSNDPLKFIEVTEELCNDRPFISKLKGTASSLTHTTVVYGYMIDPDDGTEKVMVHDPQDDPSKPLKPSTPWTPWYVLYDLFFLSNPYYLHIGDYLMICDKSRGNCPLR